LLDSLLQEMMKDQDCKQKQSQGECDPEII